LAVAGRRHDLIAIRVADRREEEIPPIGFVELEDPETGEQVVVNTSDPAFRAEYARINTLERVSQDDIFRRSKVDVIDVRTGENYVQPLMRFFRERVRRIR
jgi:uncharacterized protein (DUF58 family)